jgi:hypothetical protein
MKTYKVETRTVDIVTVNAENEEHAKELIIGNYYNVPIRFSRFRLRCIWRYFLILHKLQKCLLN